MRTARTFRCQVCDLQTTLFDERYNDELAAFDVRDWQCQGCLMHVHGRPLLASGLLSGIPMWLCDQFWTTTTLSKNRDLLPYLFSITRRILAEAAVVEISDDEAANHSCTVVLRLLQSLQTPIVPKHSRLAGVLREINRQGIAAVAANFLPLVEQPYPDRVVVTLVGRPSTDACMFAFEYRSREGKQMHLYTCYTVYRDVPQPSGNSDLD